MTFINFAKGSLKLPTIFRKHLITLYNVCVVPWGCSVPWGDIMSTVGGYLEYRGGCSVPWGYHDKCGGYLEYREGAVQYRGGIS